MSRLWESEINSGCTETISETLNNLDEEDKDWYSKWIVYDAIDLGLFGLLKYMMDHHDFCDDDKYQFIPLAISSGMHDMLRYFVEEQHLELDLLELKDDKLVLGQRELKYENLLFPGVGKAMTIYCLSNGFDARLFSEMFNKCLKADTRRMVRFFIRLGKNRTRIFVDVLYLIKSMSFSEMTEPELKFFYDLFVWKLFMLASKCR